MIRKEATGFIKEKTGINKREFIEKDLILSQLLFHLSKEKYFFDNYAFKGGTCLIKCYLGYYRFSEDLDFTYINQKELEGKSMNQMRKLVSDKIDKVAEILEKIAKPLDLRFKADKQDKDHFQFGGSNAFVTFKLWYKSTESDKENFIKLQINYIEKLNYAIKEIKAKTLLLKDFEKEFSSLFPEEFEFLKPAKIKTYDIKEVLIEKIRAILTRRGVKARDFIDVYKITKLENLKLEDFKKEIIDKIKAMLKFDKYQTNLDKKQETNFSADIDKEKIVAEEEKILLVPIPEDFAKFLSEFKVFLNEIILSLKK
ncbi:MAG: nucleotidyl transferase AbiEii/AbiGii toxin family protein [Candidatus Pacearchaeota archaeon]|nr:nucleotidyl transferase AbiEii/AbiGii toxin family protein [Candidatus Pacearchaeota archaeon]